MSDIAQPHVRSVVSRDAVLAPSRPLGVMMLAVALLTPLTLVGVVIHDEGLIATGAMLVSRGQHPYVDFLSFYGPAQYYVLAALFRAFGEDLLVLKLLHVGWMGLLVVALWAVTRESAGPKSWAPAAVALAALALAAFARHNAGYPAIPAAAFLFLAALPLVQLQGVERHTALLKASALVGVAGLFRWDFGLFGLVALVVTVGWAEWQRGGVRLGVVMRAALCAFLPALAVLALAYGPLSYATDLPRWYREVLGYALNDFARWRGVEFIRPAYWLALRGIESGAPFDVLTAIVHGAYVTVPPSAGLAVLVLALRRRDYLAPSPALVYLALLSLVLLQQMRVRPHVWQGFPALVAALPLVAWLALRGGWLRWPVRVAGGVLLGVTLLAASPNVALVFHSDLVAVDNERASLVRVRPYRAYYAELVRYVREHTPEGSLIYSGAANHSRMFVADSLLYFLADRMPADRWMELEPGIANTLEGQREIMTALESKRVPLVVLLDFPSEEENLTGVSNGVDVLDAYITRHYRVEARFGPYLVMRRR